MEDVVCHVGLCPCCGRNIREPFNRLNGPVPFVHRLASSRYCRLIVEPARVGSAHRFYVVPDEQSLEEALYGVVTGTIQCRNRLS